MVDLKRDFTTRMPLMVHAKLKFIAGQESRTINNMLVHLAQEKIKRYEKANGKIEISEEELYA